LVGLAASTSTDWQDAPSNDISNKDQGCSSLELGGSAAGSEPSGVAAAELTSAACTD